jgi:hypothetical protein
VVVEQAVIPLEHPAQMELQTLEVVAAAQVLVVEYLAVAAALAS